MLRRLTGLTLLLALLISGIAQSETPPADLAQVDAPTSVGEVGDSIQASLLVIWGDFVSHLPYLAGGAILLLITWAAAAGLARLTHYLTRRSKMRESLRSLLERLVSIAVWLVGLLMVAMVVFPGLTPAKALGGLGLASIAVGLAFKDIFENFFAGILLLWRFPFENGDYIECQGLMGKVEAVKLRMTLMRKTSGELLVVPNSFLFKHPVDVLTDRPKRRQTIIAGVAYGEDVAQSVEVIETAVRACQSVADDWPVEIFPQAFGGSSIDIEVAWWTDPTPLDFRKSRGEVVTAVKKALDEAGIEIPFPYRTLTFKEPLRLHSESAPKAS